MTDPKLQMARRIAASIYRTISDAGDYADVVASGEADRDEAVRAALAAIEECTEAHEQLANALLRVGLPADIPSAIRDHLKGPTA